MIDCETDHTLLNVRCRGRTEILAAAFVPTSPPGTTVLLINPFPQSHALKVRRDAVAHALDGAGLAYADLNMDNSGDEGKYLSVIGPYLAAHNEIGAIVGIGNPWPTKAS